MADDVTLPGTGAVVASDDVNGKQYQWVKLDGGGNGQSEPISGTTDFGLMVDPSRPPNNRVSSETLGADDDAVTINAQGSSVVMWVLIGPNDLDGTLYFEASHDDENWAQIDVVSITDLGTPFASLAVSSSTAEGYFIFMGYSQVRVRVETYNSGSAEVRLAASVSSSHVQIAGAVTVTDNGNPVAVEPTAVRSATLPSPVAGSGASSYADTYGRQLVTTIPAAEFISKSFNATTAQTGAVIWDPGTGQKIAVTSAVLNIYGTTAGRVILWFGDNGDTTYTAGTDQLLFAASATPSGDERQVVFCPASPVFCNTVNRELHITTDANVSVDVAVHGYELE